MHAKLTLARFGHLDEPVGEEEEPVFRPQSDGILTGRAPMPRLEPEDRILAREALDTRSLSSDQERMRVAGAAPRYDAKLQVDSRHDERQKQLALTEVFDEAMVPD